MIGALAASLVFTPAADAAPLPCGVIAWWPAEGNATDIVGGFHGTILGAPGFTAQGKVNNAFSFSTGGERVRLPSGPPAGEFTIEAWVYPIGSQVGYRTIYADSQRGFWLKDGKITWWFGKTDVFTGTTVVLPGGWRHIALTYDGRTFTGYVDGAIPDSSPPLPGHGLPTQTGGLLGIGGHGTATIPVVEVFRGHIDEVRIFNRALDAAEIAQIRAMSNIAPRGTKYAAADFKSVAVQVDGSSTSTVTTAGCAGTFRSTRRDAPASVKP
jgi:hypothetical protein